MAASGDSVIVFAIEAATGLARHVRQVKTGLACGCICPGCGQSLEAVNAESVHYIKRPHFRHPDRPVESNCADRAMAEAIKAAAKSTASVRLPEEPPLAPALFPIEAPLLSPTSIESFELIDSTEALLKLPGGRTLRVQIVARTWGDSDEESHFDLRLVLPADDEEIQSIDDLTRYLTLDTSCWRWCRRQTKPSLVNDPPVEPAPPPFVLESPSEAQVPKAEPPPAGKGAASASQPLRSWTESLLLPDGSTVLFHRSTWPNGVMTETSERIQSPPPSNKKASSDRR